MAVALKERTAENDPCIPKIAERGRERESELFGQVIQPDLVGAASGLWLACRRFDVDPDHFILPSIGGYCYQSSAEQARGGGELQNAEGAYSWFLAALPSGNESSNQMFEPCQLPHLISKRDTAWIFGSHGEMQRP